MKAPEPAPPLGEAGFVQARTLILVRWVAVAGQIGALLFVHSGLEYRLPIAAAIAAVAVSAAVNLFASLRWHSGAGLTEGQAFGFLAFDTLQLALLLFLTGGLQNPFALLLLAPVTVAATVLPLRSCIALAVLAAAAASVLSVWRMPLPWQGPPPVMPRDLVLGVWLATLIAIAFLAVYVSRVAREARRMTEAFAAARDALAREQRIADLGTLAAAAAHELGTPLATITVVASELVREVPADSPLAEDARLLKSQAERCKAILEELSRRPDTRGVPYLRMPLTAFIESTAEPHRRQAVALAIRGRARDETLEPALERRPELVNGLGNILSNALQFAKSRVDAVIVWDAERVEVTIQDDGPGFPAALLGRLGEPYLSTRRGSDGHMGLGIFIARTLLERTGADVAFRNRPRDGAAVEIRWPRVILEPESMGG